MLCGTKSLCCQISGSRNCKVSTSIALYRFQRYLLEIFLWWPVEKKHFTVFPPLFAGQSRIKSIHLTDVDVPNYLSQKNSIPATTSNATIHQNHPMPRGLTGSGPNSLFMNSSWSKFSSGNPRWLAYAVSDQPVCSSEPHSGQALALRGTSAPQFGQTSGAILEMQKEE